MFPGNQGTNKNGTRLDGMSRNALYLAFPWSILVEFDRENSRIVDCKGFFVDLTVWDLLVRQISARCVTLNR